MINNKVYAYEPDYSVHPGEYLEEILEARNIKKNDLAERLGVTDKHISQIINKQALISAELAVKLERILGVSANIWSNMSAEYELFKAREKEDNILNKYLNWIKNFPIKDLKNLNLLQDTNDKKTLLIYLLNFFQISSPDKFDEYFKTVLEANFRKSKVFNDNMYHILSWMRVGEIFAERIETNSFDKNTFKLNLDKIRSLTLESPETFEPEMKQLCSESGVALTFVPEFEKTHLSGVTRWLTSEKALIIMSLRHKSNDHFWFTFFHEAAHILLHGKKLTFIDEVKPSKIDEQELEANKFSQKTLIPENEFDDFRSKGFFDVPDITMFAGDIGIHPGIVVGCLQHLNAIPYNRHNQLKEKFELTI